jgi:hypothetical protein
VPASTFRQAGTAREKKRVKIAMSIDETTSVAALESVGDQSGDRADSVQRGTAVPWGTVVSLAVVMAYGDGFWLISLRGAFGAIERTQAPFTVWLRESTLTIPLYMLVVLAALAFGLRRFGLVLRRPRASLTTGLIMAGGGTLVGTVAITFSSAYDYHLQSTQLVAMNGMMECTGSCLAQLQHATLVLQLKAVALGTGLLLVSNLVLVGWMITILGGRIKVSSPRAPQVAATPYHAGNRFNDVRLLLVATLLGAAVIQAAVVPQHLQQWAAAGAFFIILAAAEASVAGLLLIRPHRIVVLTAAGLSLVTLIIWLYSRTVGLPFDPSGGRPEHFGVADVVASVLAVASVVAALLMMRAADTLGRRPAVSAHARALIVVAALAITAIGLAGTGLAVFNIFVDSGAMPTMTAS